MAVGAVSTSGRRSDAMLAPPVAVSLQVREGLRGHSSAVSAVCWDFHTSISEWEDKVMSYVEAYITR